MLGGSDPPPRCVNVVRVAPPPGGKGPKTLASKTEVDELRDELHAWLRQNTGWLLIIDSADDAGALRVVQHLLPAFDALGHVLLTSRIGTEEAFGALGIDAPLTLGALAPSDAMQLLVREAGLALYSLDDAVAERGAAETRVAGGDVNYL